MENSWLPVDCMKVAAHRVAMNREQLQNLAVNHQSSWANVHHGNRKEAQKKIQENHLFIYG